MKNNYLKLRVKHLQLLFSTLIFLLLNLFNITNTYAASVSSNFLVTLTLQAACTISANPLTFPTSGILNTNVDQTTTLAVVCSNTTPYTVGLNQGTTTGSSVTNRLLAGTLTGGATVAFQLYTDSQRTNVWANTGAGTVTGTGTGNAQTLTVYGRVPSQSTPAPDTYTSTILATVTF